MNHSLVRRIVGGATGLGLLFTTLVGSASVSAAPSNLFTNNGCTVGNYTCLRNAIGDDSFRRNFPGFPLNGFGYGGYGYGNYGYPVVAPVYNVPVSVPVSAPYTYGYPTYGAPAVQAANVTVATGTAATNAEAAAVGQAVSVPVGGFSAGEMVMVTVTSPTGQATQGGNAAAASDGTVTITATFPTAGTWQVTAHGQTSNKNVTFQFTVR